MASGLCFFQNCLVPVIARFSPAFLISITLSALLIFFSTMFFLISSKQKPNKENNLTTPKPDESQDQQLLAASQDLYSESESMDQFSCTSSEDHSSDIEWPEQRLDCSDDSISDEESLFEIAIPSGLFVSPDKASRLNLKCCELSEDDFSHQESMLYQKDFFAEMNEDNLIEIDIYMGSIKCPSFEI